MKVITMMAGCAFGLMAGAGAQAAVPSPIAQTWATSVVGVPAISADEIAKGSKSGTSGSGRSKPRIPGGSGCDDPGDIAEHPECRA